MADASIRYGLLYLSSADTGQAGVIRNSEFLDSVVTNWTARARVGREQATTRMAFRVGTNHERYRAYALDLGSGLELGPDTARIDTNWRVFFWDNDRDGSGEGGWIYFVGYGYGTSDAINDGNSEFTEMTLSVMGDSLRIQADGTVIFADVLPPRIREAGATDVRGVWLASIPLRTGVWPRALFDWIELEGESVAGNTPAYGLDQMEQTMDKATAGLARPVIIGRKRQ